MKKCTKCHEVKPQSEFYPKKDRVNGDSHCKVCRDTKSRDTWLNKKLRAVEYKGGKCISCGYNKYFGALQFHHRDPSQKDAEWGKLRFRSWEKITLELDKCDLLCANCHAEAHSAFEIY